MGTVVKLLADAYPHGCLGDVRNLTEKEFADLKALAKKKKQQLYEELKPTADKVVELTAETVKQFVKAHSRADLNTLATDAGVESPEKLANATAVAQAILDSKDASTGEDDDKEPES